MSKYVWRYFSEFFANITQLQIVLNGQIEYGEVQFYFLVFATDSPDENAYCPCPCLSLFTANSGTLDRVIQYIVGM